MTELSLEDLDTADIKLGHFQLVVYGRQFAKTEDYWDANWLAVAAHCESQGASVWAEGAIVHLAELEAWYGQAVELKRTLSGEANLDCREPNLSVKLTALGQGKIRMVVAITPDHLTQSHSFEFEIDQTYLDNLIRELGAILTKFPIKGKP